MFGAMEDESLEVSSPSQKGLCEVSHVILFDCVWGNIQAQFGLNGSGASTQGRVTPFFLVTFFFLFCFFLFGVFLGKQNPETPTDCPPPKKHPPVSTHCPPKNTLGW